MANEELVQELNETVDGIKTESGFNEVKEKVENLNEYKSEYSDLKTEIKELIYQYTNQVVEKNSKDIATFGSSITVRDDQIYRYQQSRTVKLRHITGRYESIFEHIDPKIVEWAERVQNQDFDDAKTEAKTLVTDENLEADAVTYRLSKYNSGVKIVDALGSSGSCGGDKVEFDTCCTDKINKALRHLPYIKEVVNEVDGNIEQVIENRQQLKEEIEKEVNN